MKRKMMFLALMLLIMSAAGVNAQVRIGGDADPNKSAVLDLNATNEVNNGKLGLALPRVQLTSTNDVTTITTPVTGLTVYNTATAGNGATAVAPGVYIYNGNSWTRSSAGVAPVIITQPKAFSWSRLKDANGDPNGPTTATIEALSVTAAGPGALTYQWYQKTANRNDPDIKLTGNGATTAAYTPVVTSWGMKSYYCIVKNGNDSVVSTIAEVAIGCGAKTNQGKWLRFMCYNLGADTSLDPFTYKSINDTTSKDSKGWLFQWGRATDGHQWRSSATVDGPYNSTTIQVPPDNAMYGKFIKNSSIATSLDWRTPSFESTWASCSANPDEGSGCPCPSDWRLPSSDEWNSIYGEFYSGRISKMSPTANTWILENGLSILPDGITCTLFLPQNGHRTLNGDVCCTDRVELLTRDVVAHGTALFSINLDPEKDDMRTAVYADRCRAWGVRCVSSEND